MNPEGIVLPLVGMSGGAALMIIGSSQLSAAWLAPGLSSKDRTRLGWVAVGLVGLGTVLEAVAAYELARVRKVEATA